MKHISLNGQENAVQQFILALAVEPDASILELDGKAIARMVPISVKANGKSATAPEWSNAKDARRCALVDREIEGSITPQEVEELEELQQELFRYVDRVAPLPIEDSRRLHEELLAKAAAAANSRP